MKHKMFVYTMIAVLVVCVNVPSINPVITAAQNDAYQEDFEEGGAKGWELESGWKVIQEGDNHVLAGQGHFWARSNQQFDSDYRLSFRIKLIEGTVHLVYRLNDIGRYFIGFYSDGSYLNKQIWPEEFQPDLIQYIGGHALNTWHQIEIVSEGSKLTFFVDGIQEWSYIDPQPLLNGSFAFETLSDSQAYVDNIVVTIDSAASSTALPASPTLSPPPSTELNWVRTGGPLGGLGYDIRMRPDNPDRMFVTDAWAGVFSSDNGGLTWFPSSDGITTRSGPTGDAIPVFSLTINPINPDTIWVGTQFQRGIFKSTDSGRTWKKMDNGVIEAEGITFRGFSVDPTNADIVYAAAELSSWAWSSDRRGHIGREFDMTAGVVYKTTNGGLNWQPVWRGNSLVRYVWINPQDTDVLYISTGFFDREAANSDPVSGTPGGEGILKSIDGGKTWSAVNNGLGNLYITSLFMHPTNPEILLAAAGNIQYPAGGGVYITADGGGSWINTMQDGGEIFEAVEFSSSHPSIAYAGNAQAIFRSEDGGHSWNRVTSGQNWGPVGVCAGFPIDFQIDPRNPDRIFANEYGGGNFLSSDGGKTWVDVSRGYTGSQVRDVTIDPAQSTGVLAAARSGLFRTIDGGNQWQGLSYPPVTSMEWNVVAINPSDSQHILAATNWNGLAESHDGGHTWMITAPMPGNQKGWRAIVFAPSEPETVYGGVGGFYSAGMFESSMPGGGIYVSHDGGHSWRPSNNVLSHDAHVTSLAVDPIEKGMVYAATTNHGLLRSLDGGQNWVQVAGGLPGSSSILSVTVHPNNASIILTGLERGSMFKSEDGGATWHRSASGLNPEASITDIVFDPSNPDTVYLSDLLSGVYRSIDEGKTWTVINHELLSRAVNALAISNNGLHLYAATEGNGIYRLDINGQAPQPAAIEPTTIPTPISPQSTPTSVTMIVPSETATATPQGKPGNCTGALLLPFALIGLIGWQASRKSSRG